MTPRTPHSRRRTVSWSIVLLVFVVSLAFAQAGAPPPPAPPVAPTPLVPPAPPASPPPPPPSSGIRNKIAAGDLLSAESILEVYRAKNGEDGPYLVGLSWLARGALLLGDTAKADAYATDVRKRCADLIASGRKLKTDHDTEIAFGAAIEVTAQRLEVTRGASAAADYVRGELAKIDGPVALVSRLNKRINMLAMTGTKAPELAIEDYIGNRPPTLASLHGKPVLLFLWAEGCGDCRAQEATLAKVKSRYADKLQVVAVTRYYEDSTAARVREKARVDSVWKADYKDMGTTPIVLSTASMERYGVSSTPTFVFLDGQGVVCRYTPTRLTEAEFDRTIAPLLR